MNNLLTFDTAELGYYFLLLFSGFITLVIFARNFKSLAQNSFEFNHRFFCCGLITAILTSLVLINWQTSARVDYEVEDVVEDPDVIMTPITHWPQPKVKPPPPPKTKIQLPKKLPKLFKIELTQDPTKVTKTIPSEPNEDPEPPLPIIAATPPPMPEPIIEDSPDETPFLLVDQMPRFPGCEDMEGGAKAKENCANEQLLQYIYSKLKYPQAAKENRVEGTAVLRFVVEKDGTIGQVDILRDPGLGCGAAVQEVVNSMNAMPERWTVGKQRGRPVRVMFTLPVKFKLK